MRAAKITTTVLFVTGLLLIFALPWIFAMNPGSDAPARARNSYALVFTSYLMLLLLIFFSTVVSAWIVVKKQREAFREASMSNLKELIEGTLSDHGRKEQP